MLSRLDEANNRASLEWRQPLDPERTRQIMLTTFRELTLRMGKPAPQDSDLPELKFEDEATSNLRDGVSLRLSCQRNVQAEDMVAERVASCLVIRREYIHCV